MELDDKIINAHWTKDNKGKPLFFIINEAIISKLCILGEENEPCFEGANITEPKLEFSFDDNFKERLFSMMEEIKNILNKGGASVMNIYAVEIGCALWDQIYSYLEANYRNSDGENDCCPEYRVEGIFEENGQKFAILQHRSSGKYYQLNFNLTEENGLEAEGEMFEVTQTYVPAVEPQFSLADVEAYEATRYAVAQEEEPVEEAGEVVTEEPLTDSEPVIEEEPVQVTYTLEEIPEYIELLNRYNELETNYNAALLDIEGLKANISTLTSFKADIERQEKENMIKSFYMLSDDDKKDVIENIDTYSLDDIEAKLSIICVRNRVSFSSLEDDNINNTTEPLVYNLNDGGEDLSTPAWLKAVQAVAETM